MAIDILLSTGNALFINTLYFNSLPIFKKTALPGRKKGVSGSIIIPTNFAVNNYIDKRRIKNAIEFIKFVTSTETQKKFIINRYIYSGIMELYEDKDVCSVIECDIIKDVYPFSFMNNDVKLFGDDSYHIKYREYLFDYLYRNKPLTEVLKIIDDITKMYAFSLKTDESNAGLIIFIILLIFSISTVLSLIFVFIKKLENRFKFLSKSLWIITTIGTLILMSSIITLYGDVTNAKCHLRVTLINVGFVLSICPSLLKLITNFPVRNHISLWFEKNKYICILIIMIFTGSLNGFLATSSYNLQDLTTSDGLNYRKCNMNNIFGSIIYYIIQIYDILVILISLLLIFIEWNLEETSLDVNFLATALFMDILSIIFLNIINKIRFKDYVIYSVWLAINILVFSGSNHLFIYFIRILPIFRKNIREETKILKELLNSDLNDSKKFSYTTSTFNDDSNKNTEYNKSINTNNTNNSKLISITKTIMSYHNQKSIQNISQN